MISKSLLYKVTGVLVGIEILSYLGFVYPSLGMVIASLIIISVLIVSLKNINYGLILVLAELFIGSQGYLFSLTIEGTRISLRMALWIIVMTVWFANEVREYRNNKQYLIRYQSLPYLRQLISIALVLGLGVIIGSVYNNDSSFFFLEAKRWLYIFILLPLLISFKLKEDIEKLITVLVGAVIVLCLHSVALVYIFSHGFIPLVYNIYAWMRFDLLGEITLSAGGFYRVFMQSHIFLLPALGVSFILFLSEWYRNKKKFNWYTLLLLKITVISGTLIIATLSRSFWLGLLVAGLVTGVLYIAITKPTLKVITQSFGISLGILIMSFLLFIIVVRFPLPRPTTELDPSLLSDRVSGSQAGIASRWSLLPVMWTEIKKSPLWGHGFGKTVTYHTSDPRITSTTIDGTYTTYAFEWGWLDMWLKFGLLGVCAFGWLLYSLLKDSLKLLEKNVVMGSIILFSLVVLIVVHFFTPYLNHPLGFGYLSLVILFLHRNSNQID